MRALLVALVLAVALCACAELRKVDSKTAAADGLHVAARLCDAYKRDVTAGDIPKDQYVDDACSLLLAPTVIPVPSEAPTTGGGGT